MSNSSDFTGKVVIITGSSSGIGQGIALHLAELGAQCVITGRNAQNVKRVAEECRLNSPQRLRALEVVADITREEDAKQIIDSTIKAFGKIDVLVNNAGGSWPTSIFDPNALQYYENVMKLDLRSVVYLTSLAVEHLEKTNGNIVNISSIVALKPLGQFFAYCMAKSSLDMFTKCIALELGPKGIRVNGINSGGVKSNFLAALGMTEDMVKAQEESLRKSSPLGLYGVPQDIANCVAFLASNDASFITGVNLSADGGAFLCDLNIVDD